MSSIDIFVLCVGCFSAGFTFGPMLVIYLAMRPQGYIAGNGNRIRLVQSPS
jgi:hypothetical protein